MNHFWSDTWSPTCENPSSYQESFPLFWNLSFGDQKFPFQRRTSPEISFFFESQGIFRSGGIFSHKVLTLSVPSKSRRSLCWFCFNWAIAFIWQNYIYPPDSQERKLPTCARIEQKSLHLSPLQKPRRWKWSIVHPGERRIGALSKQYGDSIEMPPSPFQAKGFDLKFRLALTGRWKELLKKSSISVHLPFFFLAPKDWSHLKIVCPHSDRVPLSRSPQLRMRALRVCWKFVTNPPTNLLSSALFAVLEPLFFSG